MIPANSYANFHCNPDTENEIEKYLDSFSKMAISFKQEANNGTISDGLLLIEKPMKFRVNYDEPHPMVIVGGKNFLSLYDYDLEELSRIDAKDNIFKFLLEFNVKLGNAIKILACENSENQAELTLLHKETEQKAKISFKSNPLALDSLTIPDDGTNFDKGVTKLEFTKIYHISNIPKNLFELKDPKIFGPNKRYSSEEIMKKLLIGG